MFLNGLESREYGRMDPILWIRERNILVQTEWPTIVGEIKSSYNICGERGPRGRRDGSLRSYSRLSLPGIAGIIWLGPLW
jgi:hypothetical protein